MISQPCSSETINIKQLTFQAENKLVNIPLSHFPSVCLNAISPFRRSNQVLERHLALVSDSPLDSSTLEAATLSSSYCRIYLRGSSDFVTGILLKGFSPLSRSNLLVLWRRIWYSLKKSPAPLVLETRTSSWPGLFIFRRRFFFLLFKRVHNMRTTGVQL